VRSSAPPRQPPTAPRPRALINEECCLKSLFALALTFTGLSSLSETCLLSRPEAMTAILRRLRLSAPITSSAGHDFFLRHAFGRQVVLRS
jgi:hypothetical protein